MQMLLVFYFTFSYELSKIGVLVVANDSKHDVHGVVPIWTQYNVLFI